MRKSIISATGIAAAAVLSFGILNLSGGAPQAEATGGDWRACVADSELVRLHLGMTKPQVARLLDMAGRRTFYSDFSRWETREYRPCTASWDEAIEIEYVRNVVVGIDAWWYATS